MGGKKEKKDKEKKEKKKEEKATVRSAPDGSDNHKPKSKFFTFSWPLRGRGGQPKRSAWPLLHSFFLPLPLIAAINNYTSKSSMDKTLPVLQSMHDYIKEVLHTMYSINCKKNPELSCLFKIAPKTINCVEWFELNLKNENPSFSQHCLVWNLDLEKTLYYNL